MQIKGAIFDMDGTLIDSLMFWDYLWEKIGTRYFGSASFHPSKEVDQHFRTMIYSEAMRYLHRACEIPCPEEEFLDFTIGGISSFYEERASVKKGAVALLQDLRSKGIRLCLASATQMSEIRLALSYHGLMEYFDVILSCADIGVGKECPDIYMEAVRCMGLAPQELCVVEDSCVALETARAAGFQTVGVYDRYNFGHDRLRAASDIYLDEAHSLEDLIPLLHP